MIDQIIVLAYLAIVLIIGLRAGRNTTSLQEFAIGNRDFSNSMLVAGIAATMIAASGTSGLTGKIYSIGLISILSYFGVVVSRFLLAFVVAPKMKTFLGALSSGDIFERLYGKEAKIMIGALTLIEGPLLAGAQILATYQACQIFFDISKETAAIITTLVVVAYSFRGGIRSVTATDVFQFIMIMVAIPIVATVCVNQVGGMGEFARLLNEKELLLDSIANGDKLKHLAIFVSISITCVFPLTIQRMLMAKDIAQIKRAFFFNGVLSIFFYIALGAIGLSAAILLPNIDPNFALPALINEILPPIIRGFVIAGLIAIFMSSSDSDMNIAAIALTQDILKPLFGKKIDDKIAIIITRASLVFSGVFALMVALYFTNALDILFFLMTIANSTYFPGMFFGIIGLAPNRRFFWLGAFAGAMTVGVMCFWMNVFPLYAMLMAIFLNSSIILLSFLPRWLKDDSFKMDVPLEWRKFFGDRGTFFEFKKSNYLISVSSYCDIFATLVLLNSLVPFILGTFYQTDQSRLMMGLNIAASISAVLLLLRQALNKASGLFVSVVWHLTIALSLTITSAINLTQNQLSLTSVFDAAAVLALLILVLEKREMILHVLGFLILGLASANIPMQPHPLSIELQYWSIFLHCTALIICLVLFRKREIAAYKFMSLKLVHEAGRTISSISNSAAILDKWLPKLIADYRANVSESSAKEELSKLLEMPNRLTETGSRTYDNLNHMLSWMEIIENKANFANHSILACLNAAINDNSIGHETHKKIHINTEGDFQFFGDNLQISNVILNLIENAGHATRGLKEAKISIWFNSNSFFIKDSGTGIPKPILPNIYDDFFSTKGTSGQGLAFCKLVMQRHNGSISCESEKGSYTIFRLDFPPISVKETAKP